MDNIQRVTIILEDASGSRQTFERRLDPSNQSAVREAVTTAYQSRDQSIIKSKAVKFWLGFDSLEEETLYRGEISVDANGDIDVKYTKH